MLSYDVIIFSCMTYHEINYYFPIEVDPLACVFATVEKSEHSKAIQSIFLPYGCTMAERKLRDFFPLSQSVALIVVLIAKAIT